MKKLENIIHSPPIKNALQWAGCQVQYDKQGISVVGQAYAGISGGGRVLGVKKVIEHQTAIESSYVAVWCREDPLNKSA